MSLSELSLPRFVRPTEVRGGPVSLPAQSRGIPLATILLIAIAVHFPLMLMQLPINSYDANYHIFFSAHYAQHWFNPWNPKWYAGFSQTTYPPLPQQWIGLFSHVMGLNLAYLLVQFIAILLIPVGVFRYAKLWVDETSASYAALASVFIGSLSFLVYQAGQLSTTVAAPLYLNALPYLYLWIRKGNSRALVKGIVLGTAAAAAHHVTLLFGSFLFALPVLWLAILDRDDKETGTPSSLGAVLFRTLVFIAGAAVVIGVVLFPFFRELLHNPFKQVPIPHPSRENYLFHPEWGINYTIIPYGALLLALPWIFRLGAGQRRLRPLFFGFWITFMLSLGGTTPIPRLLLGHAWEVLTFERFTLWACLMALPIVGIIVKTLIEQYERIAVYALWAAAVGTCGLAVAWTSFHPIGIGQLNVQPVVDFLNREDHNHYRYITLGFGEEMSRVNAYAEASTVDGDYNAGRLLPELNHYGGAQLNSAKYYGSAGMGSLLAMMKHANQYGLRYIFVRDRWYNPLLAFAGWHPTEEYDNGLITLWTKDDVPPARPVVIDPEAIPTRMESIMWGTLPIGSSILAIVLLLMWPEPKPKLAAVAEREGARDITRGSSGFVLATGFAVVTIVAVAAGAVQANSGKPSNTPDGAVHKLMDAVAAGDTDNAYTQLAHQAGITKEDFREDIRGSQNDLLSFATLESVNTQVLHSSDDAATVRAELSWSTAVGPFHQNRDLNVVNDNGHWRVDWPVEQKAHVPPQVIPLTFLEWDVIRRGPEDDWGTQDVDSPRVRIIAMNTTEYAGSTVVMGEIENEDTVPASVSVNATLLGENGTTLDQEASFDRINHLLLPKAVSPFRIDFPDIPLKQVKDIRMQTGSQLVAAAADPTIGVIHQTISTNATGQRVLSGELVNEGGKVINIPHVILTAYDNNGKLIWVNDSYVPHALLPNIPIPFSIELRKDLPQGLDNYRVIANYYLTRQLDQQ